MVEHDDTSTPEPEIIDAEHGDAARSSDCASEAPDLTSAELAAMAQHGGAFAWLTDEPDIYADEDGVPV